jgi:glucose 1-dehydrogenase
MAKEQSYLPPNEMPPRPIQPVLVGQKALVTGASKGIGKGIAVALARAGADVLVNYFSDKEGAEATAAEVREIGREALVVGADVAVEEQVQGMFTRMIDVFGRIDILINNSGIQLNAPFDQMSLAQWQRVIDINLTGQFLCAREAVRAFKRQGIDRSVSYSMGKIIHISSVHDVIPWAGHVNYAAAKGGIMLLMKSIAQELAPLRIRVNSISPGAIRTPMNLEKLTTP